MKEYWFQILLVVSTALIMWILGWVRTFLARRLRSSNPETIRKLSRNVEAMFDIQTIILDASECLADDRKDEAQKLITMANKQFIAFLKSQAIPTLESAEPEEK